METIDVPFPLPIAFIDDLVEGMVLDMGVNFPANDAEKLLLFQNWVKVRAKDAIRNARVNRAAQQVVLADVEAW